MNECMCNNFSLPHPLTIRFVCVDQKALLWRGGGVRTCDWSNLLLLARDSHHWNQQPTWPLLLLFRIWVLPTGLGVGHGISWTETDVDNTLFKILLLLSQIFKYIHTIVLPVLKYVGQIHGGWSVHASSRYRESVCVCTWELIANFWSLYVHSQKREDYTWYLHVQTPKWHSSSCCRQWAIKNTKISEEDCKSLNISEIHMKAQSEVNMAAQLLEYSYQGHCVCTS